MADRPAVMLALGQPPTRTDEVAEAFERLEHEELIATAGDASSGTIKPLTHLLALTMPTGARRVRSRGLRSSALNASAGVGQC
jgi:hypothetical protein